MKTFTPFRRLLPRALVSALSLVLLHFPSAAEDSGQAASAPAAAPSETPALTFTVEEDREAVEKETGGAADFTAVIDADDIARRAAVSVAQVLELATGVRVTRTGSAAQGAYISIRGSSSEQVLVLLNGKRLNSAQGGGVDLSSIDPETIEKIEVLRGGAAARYGENALGGVVNIITRQAKKESGGSAYLQYGSWQTVKGGVNLEGVSKDGSLDGFLSASGLFSEGAFGYPSVDGSVAAATRENADVRSGDLYGTAAWYLSDSFSLKGVLSGHADEKGVPGIPQFPTASARMDDQRASASLDALWERDASRLSSSVSSTFHRRRYVDPEYALGAQDDTHVNLALQSSTEGKLRFPLPWMAPPAADSEEAAVEGSAAVNADLRFDALRSTAVVRSSGVDEGDGDILRYQGSASARADLPLFELPFISLRPVLYPSVRFDASLTDNRAESASRWSDAISWQTGIAVPWKNGSLKANVGTSYRSPSFDDLFWPSTAFAAGNAGLKPERAFAWDAGMEFSPGERLRVEFSYFERYVSDLIVWTPGAGGIWRPSNIDSARVRGVEFQGRLSIPLDALAAEFVSEGTAAWLDPRDTTPGSVNEGNLLPGKAPLAVSASFEFRRKNGLFLRTEASYTSCRYITSGNTKALDPYLVCGLGAGLSVGKNWRFVGRLENIFDQVYYDLRDYPVPGREFSLRMSYEW